jgi:hypothetical protein
MSTRTKIAAGVIAVGLAVGGGVIYMAQAGGANTRIPPPHGPPPAHNDEQPPPYQGPTRPPGVQDGQDS